MKSRVLPIRSLHFCMLALLLTGVLFIPARTRALESMIISVDASDAVFEEGVLITWPEAQTDSVLFRIYRDGLLLSYLPSSATSYLDTTATVRTAYEYCLRMYDVSTDSEIDLGCDEGTRAFFNPTSINASDCLFDDRVRVTWTDQSWIETGYEIWREHLGTGSDVLVGTTDPDTETLDDTSAVAGESYSYCVKGVRDGQYTDSFCDTGVSCLILPPGSVEASDGEYTDRVVVIWFDQSDDEVAFGIYRDAVLLGSVPADSTRYEDLTALGTAHTYCVTSIGDAVESPLAIACDDGVGGDSTMTAPFNVHASFDEFDDRVEVTWDYSSDTADGFDIYRAGSLIATVDAEATSYLDFDAPPGVAAAYTVVAVSEHGGSSVAVSGTGRRSLVVPPTDVEVSQGDFEAYAEITWESASTTAVLFVISRDGAPIKTVGAAERSCLDFDIAPGSDYTYCVWGVSAMGDTSDHVCGIGRRELAAPGAISASDDEYEAHVLVTWMDESEVEEGYYIYRDGSKIDSSAANRQAFKDTTGLPGVTYEYSVTAFDGWGESEPGSDTGSRALLAPTSVEATDGAFEDRVLVTWEDNSFAEMGYAVYRKHPHGDSAAVLIGSTGVSEIEFTDTSPAFGVVYTYSLAAFDGYGESGRASDEGFSAILPPGSVNASETYEDRVVVTWFDQSDIELVYEVQRDGALIGVAGPDVTTFTDVPPAQEVAYEYCVRSKGGSSESGFVCDTGMRVAPPEPLDVPVTRLVPDPAGRCGAAVSIDGRFLAASDTAAQCVYIFEQEGTAWDQNAKISEAWETFGYSVDVCGDFAIAGAPLNDLYDGAAAIYGYNGSGWVRMFDEVMPGGMVPSLFGMAVAMGEDFALVGAPSAAFVGFALSYKYDGSGWAGMDTLTSPDPGWAEMFGTGVAIDGNYAIIGEALDGELGDRAGVAHVYEYDGSGLTYLQKLTAGDGAADANFGMSAAIDGDLAIIGAPYADDSTGAAYIFARPADSWTQVAKLTASSGVRHDGFGWSVAIAGDVAVVGTKGDKDAAYIFEYDPSSGDWVEFRKLTGVRGFGEAVDIDGHHLAVGSYDEGAVYVYHIGTAPVTAVRASDGTFEDRIRVEWEDDSPERAPSDDGFKVYRDGQLIASIEPGLRSYNDFSADPGGTYEYGVRAYSDEFGEADALTDHGRRPSDGAINGRVTSRAGAGVESVMVRLSPPPNSALLFDGSAGYVQVDNPIMPTDAFTVEFWAKGTSGATLPTLNASAVCYATGPGLNEDALIVGNYMNDLVEVVIQGTRRTTSCQWAEDNDWHHFAVTWQATNGRLRVYRDGELQHDETGVATGQTIAAGGTLVFGQDLPDFEESAALVGQLDEVRIWSGARGTEEIQAAMYLPLSGDENGLLGYWPLDEAMDRTATADITENNAYGTLEGGVYWTEGTDLLQIQTFTDLEGSYSLSGIPYGSSSAVKVIPSLDTRSFQPSFKAITLDTENPVQNQVDFTDVSSFTVAGIVYFEDTQCVVRDAQIYVDNIIAGTTDAEGRFKVAVAPGHHIIDVRLEDHTFEPAFTELEVTKDTYGHEFRDTLLRKLSGHVGGGCDLSFGTLDIEIKTEDGCFDTTLSGLSQNYEVLLPAQAYLAEVTDVHVGPGSSLDPVDVERFFENLGPRKVSLRDSSAELDFIYRAPLALSIEGLPEVTCDSIRDPDRGVSVPGVPVIGQGEALELSIRVYEDYGEGGLCPVNSGTVSIFDEIKDVADKPVVLTIEDGLVTYTTVANTPNIFYGRRDVDGNDRSYQKSLTAVVEVEGLEPVQHTEWVIVTGDLPRSGTFVSATTEEFPLLILRDPPGDGSYSYLEREHTFTSSLTTIFTKTKSGGVAVTLDAGIKVENGIWAVSTEAESKLETAFGVEVGVEATAEGGLKFSLTSSERFATSGGPDFVGQGGDVYLGIAMNLIFAKTDVIDIDDSREPCTIAKSQKVRFGVKDQKPFETIYLYTHDHIEKTLIPQLEELAVLEPDSAATFESYAANWRRHLDRNDSLTAVALKNPWENRSFSAGADHELSIGAGAGETIGGEVKVFANAEASTQIGFKFAGAGAKAKLFAKIGFSVTVKHTTEFGQAAKIGYVLTDDDPGDYFSTDIALCPKYVTPVFGTRSGRSSCPWEAKTQPRDSVIIAVEPPVRHLVPPEEPATFTLSITNATPSKETRTYVLVPVQTSNPGGAVLKVNGEQFHDGLHFSIGPDQTQEATLTVERGPTKYYYEDLTLRVSSPCDGAISDDVSFSVDFLAPCSDITLYRPQPGWSFNLEDSETYDDSLELVLTDFELRISEADSIEGVGAEYRRHGTDDSPIPIEEILRSDIGINAFGDPMSQFIMWPLSYLNDGVYEVRAYTRCSLGGKVYSPFATGTIDRDPPAPFGAPQPADGELALADEISVTFDETIMCNSATPLNIKLVAENPDNGTTPVGFDIACDGAKIILTPEASELPPLEGRTLIASVSGIKDKFGNVMVARDESPTETWEFSVSRSEFVWSETNIIRRAAYRYPASLTAVLVNGTSNTVDYSIIDLPDWLTPDAPTGSLLPEESRDITFAISDTLGLGPHDVTVLAVTGDSPALVAPLDMTVDVVCQTPVWVVDPARFEHSMSIMAVVEIDGSASEDTSDMVAAYVGNQLRGVARPVYEPVLREYLVYLTVFSSRTSGETVRFRVWDDSDCRIFGNTDRVFPFEADSRIGTPEQPEVLVAHEAIPGTAQIIELAEGWSWFSLNLVDVDMTANGVLSDLNPWTGDLIKSQTDFAQFDPDYGWVGSLTELDNQSCYAIQLSEIGTIIHRGAIVSPDTVPMPGEAGWHWIGYLPQGGLDISVALADFGAREGDAIKSLHEFAQYARMGPSEMWFGSLNAMEPGEGYRLWIGRRTDDWYYPPASGPVPPVYASGTVANGEEPAGPWSVEVHQYEHSMNLIGQLRIDGSTVESSEHIIGAFVGDEVRGVAPLRYVPQLGQHLAFLTIYSSESEGDTVEFRAYDCAGHQEIELEETVTFLADHSVGLLASPFNLTGKVDDSAELPAAFALARSIPNPLTAGSKGVIRYALPTAEHVTIDVFDVRGRHVVTLVDRDQQAGWYHVDLEPADFASGIYFYRMNAGGFSQQQKMTVVH